MKISKGFGRKPFKRIFWTAFVMVAVSASPAPSQDAPPTETEPTEEELEQEFFDHVETFGWERTGKGKLGSMAEIAIPEGFRFTGPSGTKKLMEIYGNSTTEKRDGILAPENLDWFVIFAFEDSGYVKDDEKDDIDADALLKDFKEGQKAANIERRKQGLETLTVVGWAKAPFYNEKTNNLEWALKVRDESGIISVNYKTKLLGRHGVMDSILVCGEEQLDEVLPVYQNLIKGYNYVEGKSYGDFKEGDKIAKYGLTALIAGGAGFAVVKSGLLGMFLGFLKKGWILIVAVFVGIGSFFKRLFGGGNKKNQFTVDQ